MNGVLVTAPTPGSAPSVRVRPQTGWPVPVALIALSLIPLAAGTLRLLQLAGGPAVIPADQRFAAFPAPLVVHIAGAALYALVGAFQFLPRFRRNHMTWHRRTGRVLAVAGLLVAGSALWMTVQYSQKAGTGDVLFALRLVFASAMGSCLVLGVNAARAHNIPAHRAWMIRAYAIGLAAGTQAFTEPLGAALFGTGDVRDDLAKAAGWIINLAVAEWAIRRTPRPQTTPTARPRRPPTHLVRTTTTTATNPKATNSSTPASDTERARSFSGCAACAAGCRRSLPELCSPSLPTPSAAWQTRPRRLQPHLAAPSAFRSRPLRRAGSVACRSRGCIHRDLA